VTTLHALLGRLRGAGDAGFALAVVAVVVLLVVPVPPPLLDFGLALSLALAVTVLVVTLLARDALSFASFPALLLLTTLLRLALSVSSTRLVLTRGEAGRVIEAFGRVVVQGSPVAGAVVFAILTLVQLLVVARGAERVAEVAARFTLDALPGKQLAIDADLRAGLLDAAGAARRRRALEREGQLHGAMDGALKFVKGDAVAGVVIVLVNALGGLVALTLRGRPLGAAAERAVLLAVGDGLTAQLPALLMAVAAGVAVTRVASADEGTRLGSEVGRQLLGEPRALLVVAGLLAMLALGPGLPAAPFLLLAAGAAGLAWRGRRQLEVISTASAPGAASGEAGGAALAGAETPGVSVALELGEDLHELARSGDRRLEETLLPAASQRLWRELGVVAWPRLRHGPSLEPGRWSLLVDEVPAAGGRISLDERLSLAPLDDLALAGIAFRPGLEPLRGRPAALVDAADGARAEALGPVLDPLELLAAACAGALERNAGLLVGVQETQSLLEALEPRAPALVREVARQLPPALLAEVLRRLLEEGVSIRPLRTILEALLEAGGGPRGAAALAAAARRALRRQLGHRASGGDPLQALIIDPRAEQLVRESLLGEWPALEPERAALLLDGLERALLVAGGEPVLLASGDVRRALRLLVAPRWPRLQVLGYDELPPELPVRPLGRLELAA
jgi:type III secretion protein V